MESNVKLDMSVTLLRRRYSSLALASGLDSFSDGLSTIESTDSSSHIETAESKSFGANL